MISGSSYRWWGLGALLSGTFVVVLSLSFLFPATPIIMRDFNVSIETVAWLSLAYALGASVFEPMFGRLGDLHGRRRNCLIGLGIFTVGAVACALSPDVWVMAGARFVQGLGAAAVIPIGMAFVGENFSEGERGRALGLWGMVSGSAPAIGPTLGGYLIDWQGWRAIYYVSVVLGILGFLAVALVVRESRRPRVERFDLVGSVLLFLSVGSLLVVLNQGRSWGWTSLPTLGFTIAFALLFIVFVLVEQRVKEPLVDLKMVQSRLFVLAGLAVFVSFLVFQGAFFLIPFFLQEVQGYPAGQTGQLVIPLFLAIMGASLLSGRISDKLGARVPAAIGMVLVSISLYMLSLTRQDTAYTYLLGVMAILGLGLGATLPPLSRAVTGAVPLRRIGSASGVFNMIRNLGGPVGVALGATLFASLTAQQARISMTERLGTLGLDPSVIGQLERLRQGASQGMQTVPQMTQDMVMKLEGAQQAARIDGMVFAFGQINLVLLAVSLVGLVATLLIAERRKTATASSEVQWTPEAKSVLERIPESARERAEQGIETFAREVGVLVITPEIARQALERLH